MFSLDIVDTDAFLDMPTGSQLLYFHLSMRADDEGFVSNPKKIMRIIGSQDDDYKVLIAKKFVIPFESGVCVIKHWLIHNTIRMDRFGGTTYIKEKNQLLLKDNKSYKLIDLNDKKALATKRQPSGNHLATQVKLSKVNISKDKISKDKLIAEQSSADDIVEILTSFKDINPSYKKYYGNTTQRKAVQRMLVEHGKEKLLATITYLEKSNKVKYAPTITTAVQLEDKLGALVAWSQKLKENKKEIIGL